VSRKLSLVVLILVCIVTLWFGLRPLDFFPENRVRWLSGQDGIQFYKQGGPSHGGSGGIIYTNVPVQTGADSEAFEPVTIEVYLEPHGYSSGGLEHILSFHDGYPISPLVIGQWKNYLTIRSRDNNNPARDTYREIGLKEGLKPGEKKLITIASGTERTEIYVNGDLARSYDIRSLIGAEHIGGYLSIGNSAIGHNGWTGKLFGLATYDSLLTPEQISKHCRLWSDGIAHELIAVKAEPKILYTFSENEGDTVHNHAGDKNHLTIPPEFRALKRVAVIEFWETLDLDMGDAEDILVNIFGFVPFAFCVMMFLAGYRHISTGRAAFFTVLAGAVLSLVIEIGQLALPARTPSSLDFLCNTAGAVLAVAAFRVIPPAWIEKYLP